MRCILVRDPCLLVVDGERRREERPIVEDGSMVSLPLDAVMPILSAMFDRAALAVEAGRPARDHVAVIKAVPHGLSITD